MSSNVNMIDKMLWSYYKKNNNITDEELISKIKGKKKEIEGNNISIEEVKIRLNKISKYRKKLNELKKMPLVKQRTPEWFELRKNRLTASDMFDAITSSSLQLAKKKAGVLIDEVNLNKVPAIKWGTMFEDMAMRCYSQRNDDITINEFGLIPDKELEHFGASPDGISELGIMIEIKCPYSRKIKDGFIPPKYHMQMQGQLAVCDLEECDFLECNFKEFKELDEYINTIGSDCVLDHGLIAEFGVPETDSYYYLYSSERLTPQECLDELDKKVLEKINEDKTVVFNKLIPWKLEELNVQRITFDKNEWCNLKPKIIKFWDKVEECKKLPVEYKKKEPKRIEFIKDED